MKKHLGVIIFIIILLTFVSCKQTPPVVSETNWNAAYFHFTSDLESWVLTDRDGISDGFTLAAHNADPAFSAEGTTGSAKITCAFGTSITATESVEWFARTFPISNLKDRLIGARIYVPSDLAAISPGYSVRFSVRTPDGYMLQSNKTLNTTGWAYYYTTITAGTKLEECTEVSVVMTKTVSYTADWAGDIYIDEVFWR